MKRFLSCAVLVLGCAAQAGSVAAVAQETTEAAKASAGASEPTKPGIEGSGFSFRHGDLDDLERMLRLLISEPEVRKAAASKARERVWEHYLWSRVAREIEGVYLKLAGGNILPKPRPAREAGFRHRAA